MRIEQVEDAGMIPTLKSMFVSGSLYSTYGWEARKTDDVWQG